MEKSEFTVMGKTMEQITIEPESSTLQALIDIDRDMAAGLIADQPAN